MKKRAFIFAIVGMLAAGMLTGCGSVNDEDIVATVGEEEISVGIANFYARYTQAQYETYYSGYLGEDMWNTEAQEGQTYEEFVKESVITELERMIILEQHMGDYEVSLTDEEKALIEKAAGEFDEANALDAKEQVSGSEDTVKRVLTLMAIQQKMSEAIGNEADPEVSDEEAAQKSMQYVQFSYSKTDEDGNAVDLTDEEKTELKSQAETFAEGAKAGGDFAELATEQGVEAQTATFDAESTTPDAAVIEAADALGEGEVTDVIETDTGCYVAKVTSLLDREATDTEKENIVQQRRTDLYNETCEGWLEEVDVELNEKIWNKIDFNELSVTIKQSEEDPYSDPIQTDDQVEESESSN